MTASKSSSPYAEPALQGSSQEEPQGNSPGMSAWSLVLTTTGSEEEAEAIAAHLIAAKLAACVSIQPIRSVYTWQGKVHKDAEWQLQIKTRLGLFEAIAKQIKQLHSYDVPELIAIPVRAGSADYLNWMNEQVMQPS